MKQKIYTIKFKATKEVLDKLAGSFRDGETFHGLEISGISVGDMFTENSISENALRAVRDGDLTVKEFSSNSDYMCGVYNEYNDLRELASDALDMMTKVSNLTECAEDAEKFYNATSDERYKMMV